MWKAESQGNVTQKERGGGDSVLLVRSPSLSRQDSIVGFGLFTLECSKSVPDSIFPLLLWSHRTSQGLPGRPHQPQPWLQEGPEALTLQGTVLWSISNGYSRQKWWWQRSGCTFLSWLSCPNSSVYLRGRIAEKFQPGGLGYTSQTLWAESSFLKGRQWQ